ncbi:major facilitator superfamily transporter [Immersiella caudata]|uniref:Major facilitator superfamily transporter n=1 Tax=Immersiella caudata TaxID=314043 RepID=A0AA39X5H5_9PEZI|nr:major facilitator superfamily transporter [Immersiella caudata]
MAVAGAENKSDEPQITADSSGASQSTMHKTALEAPSQGASSDTTVPDVAPFAIEDDKPALRIPLPRFILLASAICLGFFLALLDTSIVATSLHVIAIEFQDTETIYWVALSYTLAYLSCAVLFARISDVIGRRAAVLAAYVIFIAFSLACGWAQNLPQLIAFRALQGVGGSGLYSLTMIILPEVAPLNYQGVVSSLIGIVLAASGVLGPLIGGVLTQYASWRWVFWINGPIGGVSVVAFYFIWPEPEYLPAFHPRKWKEVDFLGAFLLVAAAALIVFPFQNSGVEGGNWSSPRFIAPLVFGVVSLTALFVWQWFVERRWPEKFASTLPMVLLRNRAYSATVIHATLTGFPYFVAIYTFPMRFQVVNGKNPFEAGLMLLPMLAATALGSLIAGAVNGKVHKTAETMGLGATLMLLGCALETTAGTGVAVEGKVLGFLVFVGVGFGLVAAGGTMSGIYTSPAREHATAQGIIAQVRVLGGSIGIAASSAILSVEARKSLGGGGVNPELLLHTGGSVLTPEQQEGVRVVYTAALKNDMIVCSALLAAAVVAAVFVYQKGRLPTGEVMKKRVGEEIARVREEKRRTIELAIANGELQVKPPAGGAPKQEV